MIHLKRLPFQKLLHLSHRCPLPLYLFLSVLFHPIYSALQNELLDSERKEENDNDMEGWREEKDSQVLLKAQITLNHHVEVVNIYNRREQKGRLEIDKQKQRYSTCSSSHSNILTLYYCIPIWNNTPLLLPKIITFHLCHLSSPSVSIPSCVSPSHYSSFRLWTKSYLFLPHPINLA